MLRRMTFVLLFLIVMIPITVSAAFALDENEGAQNPSIDAISFVCADGAFNYYENAGGAWSQDGSSYIYKQPTFKYGDKLLVICEGKETEYTYSIDPYSDENVFLAEGNKVIPSEESSDELPGERVYIGTDQETHPWTVGAENFATITYCGVSCLVPVNIIENPVGSIEYYTSQEFSVINTAADKDGYYDEYQFEFNIGDKLTIQYKDGSTVSYNYVLDGDDKLWQEDGTGAHVISPLDLTFGSDQKQVKWSSKDPAKNYLYVTYLGCQSNHIPVTIQEDISKAKVTLKKTKFTYTGKTITPPKVVSVVFNGKKLKEGVDYKCFLINSEQYWIGHCDVIVNGCGAYGGTVLAGYSIVPKGTSLTKLVPAKKAVTVKWKKQSTKMYNWASGKNKQRITGYQIQISTSKKFTKKNTKTITVKGYSKTSYKVKNLKTKKKYFVRVRTYVKPNQYSQSSSWSKTGTVNTK